MRELATGCEINGLSQCGFDSRREYCCEGFGEVVETLRVVETEEELVRLLSLFR